MPPELDLSPDLTPEEIAAMQNPGGQQGSAPQNDDAAAAALQAAADAAAQNAGDNQQASGIDATTQGRIDAAERRANEALARASMLEQNNKFLEGKAADAATRAETARTEAEANKAQAKKLQDQIALSNAPKINQATRDALVELHGEAGAKPLIEMEERFLAQSHMHALQIEDLKAQNAGVSAMVQGEFDKRSVTDKAAAFNSALMDSATGVPNLKGILDDPKFIAYLQSDTYGKLVPFNEALKSNDPAAVATIRAITTGFAPAQGGNGGVDAGSSGTGARGAATGQTLNREQAVTEWNRLLDAGQVDEATAFSKKHGLNS